MTIINKCLAIYLTGFIYICTAQLEVKENLDEVDIFFQDVWLFHHSSTAPILRLAEGQANFSAYAGNFEIDEDILQVIPLPNHMNLAATPQFVTVTFTNEPQTYQVRLILQAETSSSGSVYLDFNTTVLEPIDPTPINRIFINLYSEVDEQIYGAGEQYTYFNLKGHNFPVWTREQGVGRIGTGSLVGEGAYHTTYWPQASFVSKRLLAVLIDNTEYLVLNFEPADYTEVFLHSVSMSGVVLWESDVMSLVQSMVGRLGLQPMLPDWVMTGAILGLEEGTDEVLMHYDEAKSHDVEVTALWVQDWSGTVETAFGHRVYWNWKWNETYYEDLDIVIEQLANESVRFMVYCNPHLIEGSELYLEASSQGYLLTNDSGEPYHQDFGGFFAGTVDLMQTAAREWYRDTLSENILDIGISGWMADFGEYTTMDMHSKNIQYSPEQLHNELPVVWAQTNREMVEMAGTLGDSIYFMRSGGLGSSGHQLLTWAGDQNVDFSYEDGVASTVVAALSLSMSGMGLTHFDIGGYTTQKPLFVRTKELFLRSAEYAVFTPVMRTHLGNKPEDNHQFYSSNDTMDQFARLTQMHTTLFPYTKAVVNETAYIGTPAQRPTFLQYPDDNFAWDQMYQYMFGQHLIVAPILNEGQTLVSMYVPYGDDSSWMHLWQGLGGPAGPFQGPQFVSIEAPLGFPAVLYRIGSEYEELFQEMYMMYGPSPP